MRCLCMQSSLQHPCIWNQNALQADKIQPLWYGYIQNLYGVSRQITQGGGTQELHFS